MYCGVNRSMHSDIFPLQDPHWLCQFSSLLCGTWHLDKKELHSVKVDSRCFTNTSCFSLALKFHFHHLNDGLLCTKYGSLSPSIVVLWYFLFSIPLYVPMIVTIFTFSEIKKRKRPDKFLTDQQERAFWKVNRPPVRHQFSFVDINL